MQQYSIIHTTVEKKKKNWQLCGIIVLTLLPCSATSNHPVRQSRMKMMMLLTYTERCQTGMTTHI